MKALDLLKPYLESINDHRSTFLCGAAGPLAIGAVLYSHLGQEHKAGELVQRLKDLFLEHKVAFRDLPSELLYGHAGYLYALLFANSHLPGAVEEKLIDEVGVGFPGIDPTHISLHEGGVIVAVCGTGRLQSCIPFSPHVLLAWETLPRGSSWACWYNDCVDAGMPL